MKQGSISLVVPAYNEALNLPIFYERVTSVLKKIGRDYEIVVVDDGSKDNSFAVLSDLATKDNRLKVICFRHNFGQTAALSAGIEAANGDVIILIDSDLENDPEDINTIINKMDEGYDVVSGWRKNRWKGQFLTRKIPSLAANSLISKVTGVKLNDFGCTLKGYRRDVIKNIMLYGEMHRFIPAYAKKQGARIGEVEVRFAPRIHGKSNYRFSRLLRVLPDLLLLKFLEKYMNRPMHFFAYAGFWSFLFAFVTVATAIVLRFTMGISLIQTPLPTLAGVLLIIGTQFFLMGIIAEMMMRTYYESQSKRPYTIKESINIQSELS
jgi:glycosyltransferase involved in cell wall biosynthesis